MGAFTPNSSMLSQVPGGYPPAPGGYPPAPHVGESGALYPNLQSCGLYPQPGGTMPQQQYPGMGYPGQPGQTMPGYPQAPSPNPPMPGYGGAPSPNPSMPAYGGGAMPVAPSSNVRDAKKKEKEIDLSVACKHFYIQILISVLLH